MFDPENVFQDCFCYRFGKKNNICCLTIFYFEIGLNYRSYEYQVQDFDDFHIRVYDRFLIIETVNSTVSSTRVGCYSLWYQSRDRFLAGTYRKYTV